MILFVRIGSTGELEQFPDIETVAAYLNTLSVGRPTWWCLHGFDTQNYWGSDNISVFWGDDLGNYLESISTADQVYLEAELDEAEL